METLAMSPKKAAKTAKTPGKPGRPSKGNRFALNIKMPVDLIEAIGEIAARERRDRMNMIQIMLEDAVERMNRNQRP